MEIDMNAMPVAFLAALLGMALVGCAATPRIEDPRTEIDRQILDATKKIQAAQTELYQAGAVNSETDKRSVVVTENQQLVTVTWQGDALQLLNKLARDRGLQFAFMGVRQPLPVNVEVKNMPFADALEQVRAQVGYRASVTQSAEKLLLHYNRPQT
jgi:defect in organelle trafficking protein DotD